MALHITVKQRVILRVYPDMKAMKQSTLAVLINAALFSATGLSASVMAADEAGENKAKNSQLEVIENGRVRLYYLFQML